VEKVYAVTNDRWSVVIRKRKPAGDKSLGMRLEVGVFRDCQYVTSYAVTSDSNAPGGIRILSPVRSHADLLACGHPQREAESIRRLINTAEDLCRHLLRARSLTKWCKDKGLAPVAVEENMATGAKRVTVMIDMHGQFIVC
jgi:hypothetical protein